MAYLQLRGIEKFFGEHRAIKGIDLTINQEKIFKKLGVDMTCEPVLKK